jgi:hypothetical protein
LKRGRSPFSGGRCLRCGRDRGDVAVKAHPAHHFQVLAGSIRHPGFHGFAFHSHHDCVSVVLGSAEKDVKGGLTGFLAVDSDARDFLQLGVFEFRVDQQGLDIVLVLPGNAGPCHPERRIHDGAYLLSDPAYRQNDVSGEGSGYPVGLVDGLLDKVRYQGHVHGHRGAVSLHAGVGLDVFHMHFVAHVGRPDGFEHFLDGGAYILGRSLGDIPDFAGSTDGVGCASVDLAVDRQGLAVHLAAGAGLNHRQAHHVTDRIGHGADVLLEVLFVLLDFAVEGPLKA